jgi:hypothetical protein
MPKAFGQDLKMLQLTQRVLDDYSQPGKLPIKELVFFIERMITSGFSFLLR